MNIATFQSSDVIVNATKRAKEKVPRVLYAKHAKQITPNADVRVLNLNSHMQTLKVACTQTSYVFEHGKLPAMGSDASASDLSEMFGDIGKLDVDSIGTTRVIDEAS